MFISFYKALIFYFDDSIYILILFDFGLKPLSSQGYHISLLIYID
jgi:hypothetical protein